MKPKKKYKLIVCSAVICMLLAVVLSVSIGVVKLDTVFGEGKKLPIYSVATNEKKIAISFDAAWGNEHTKPILDILDKYGVKATFFLVEFWVDKFPEDVLEIYQRGHEIGNHSSTHPNMAKLSREQIVMELKQTEGKIEAITGERPTVFRPPFGSYNNNLIEACEEIGYYVIQWDVDSLDWKDISAEQIVDRVTRHVKNGSIVLFHNNAEHVEQYLPLIIEKLQADGYKIVPVGELIIKEDYHMDHAGKQVAD